MVSSIEELSFLSAADVDYIAGLYQKYVDNPENVDASWNTFFASLDEEGRLALEELTPASWRVSNSQIDAVMPNVSTELVKDAPSKKKAAKGGISEKEVRAATLDSVQALMIIRAYRVRGHLLADVDPLNLQEKRIHPELDPKTYGFEEKDMDRPIFINGVLGFETATMREIVAHLRATYCGTIGVEFMQIQNPEQKAWVQERIETGRNHTDFSKEGKTAILERLTAAEGFEKFLHVKHPGTKRFGLDGGEALVPAIEQIMKRGGQLGLKEMVLGMAHRGRLNVLTNVMGKAFTAVFSEFQGSDSRPEDVEGSGDVKYHLGTSSDRDFDGNVVHLSLTANPSHLETVDPVVLGKAKAKQDQLKDDDKDEVMGLLLHGDAAFAGQGVVMESLMLSGLEGYGTGGTIHIVINNQIGFTTSPKYSRSGHYATDIAKMLQVPIFHVNGDDAEAVVHVARIAMEYRQMFKKDVVIDLLCYRRHGHNEGDEPAFTQPLMYKNIAKHKTTRQLYGEALVKEGSLSEADVKKIYDDFAAELEQDFQAASDYKVNQADRLQGQWQGMGLATDDDRRGKTGITEEAAQKVGKAITTIPEGFNLNKKIARQLDAKKAMFETGEGFDWATAEALAFGTLADEGYPVRLSGQDCGRGTFSQRHSVWTDQETENRYVPLNHISETQATYTVHDSPLSEYAVLGFEYGYSMAEPNALVMWEAQFGDFANGAQIMFDQFISAAETKWMRMSGLTMLLPHGYEGQGPEHSSCRIERYLQMCGEDNWQVLNCTTPANYFHALRRQMHRDFRKPLVIATPKSLLRHKSCVSKLEMMTGDQSFHRVLYEDQLPGPAEKMKRVVLCTGKVFYDLEEERNKRGITDVTMLRLEQLYPFPDKILAEELAKFPNAEVIWCQEEPENMGAWNFVDRRIEKVLVDSKHKCQRPTYVGRIEAASPATGLLKQHNAEQAKLIDEALTVK